MEAPSLEAHRKTHVFVFVGQDQSAATELSRRRLEECTSRHMLQEHQLYYFPFKFPSLPLRATHHCTKSITII